MAMITFGFVLAAAAQTEAIQVTDSTCIDPSGILEMDLPFFNKSIVVPSIDRTVSAYSYATDNAMVTIPSQCREQYKDSLPAFNILDDKSGGPKDMSYFRVASNRSEEIYATLAEMAGTCACGLVIAAHGSSGARYPTYTGVTMAGMGFIVVVPDSMAMPDSTGLKGRRPFKETKDIDMSDYCGSYNPYLSSCGSFSKPLCYSTKTDNIFENSTKYMDYVERVYLVRKLELDYFVESRDKLLKAFDRVFLFGTSEGGMVASRYYHPTLHPLLSGLIIKAWSCEFNYFVSCDESANVCEDKCSKQLPVLNMIGTDDEYFGASDSISSEVAADDNGYGGPLTGNCRARLDAQKFTRSVVVLLDETDHDDMATHDNVMRSLYADFIAAPTAPTSWTALEGCSLADNVYTCGADGVRTCKLDWTINPDSKWENNGTILDCNSEWPENKWSMKVPMLKPDKLNLMGFACGGLASMVVISVVVLRRKQHSPTPAHLVDEGME